MTQKSNAIPTKKPPIAIILLLLALLVAGLFVYKQNQQIGGEGEAHPSTSSRPVKEDQLAQAKLIREKWQGWAMKHQDDLSKLRKSSGTSPEAYRKVFDEIPEALTPESGLVENDLKSASKEDPTHPHRRWDWAGVDRHLLTLSGPAAGFAKDSIKLLEVRVKEEQTQIKDCLIAKSINGGTTNVFVWASGRITEGTREKKEINGMQTFSGATIHTELAPAYDFIK